MITEEELLEKIKALKMKFHLDLNHAEKNSGANPELTFIKTCIGSKE